MADEAASGNRPRWWEIPLVIQAVSGLAGTLLGGVIGFTTARFSIERQTAAQIHAANRNFEAVKYEVQFPLKVRLWGELRSALVAQYEYAAAINEKRRSGKQAGSLADYQHLLDMMKETNQLAHQLAIFVERRDVAVWLIGYVFFEAQQALHYTVMPDRTYEEGARGIAHFNDYHQQFTDCLWELLFAPPKPGEASSCPTPSPTATPAPPLSGPTLTPTPTRTPHSRVR